MASNFHTGRKTRKKDNAQALRHWGNAGKGSQQEVGKKLSGEANGIIVAIDEIGNVRSRDIARGRHASSILAGVFNLALEVPSRLDVGLAVSVATTGVGFFPVGSNGAGRTARKIVDRTLRTRAGL